MIIMAGVGEDMASSRCMPDLDRFIDAARGDIFAVGGPGDGLYGQGMPTTDGDAALASHVPDLHLYIVRTVIVVAKGDILAIGRPGETGQKVAVGITIKEAQRAGSEIPDAHGVVEVCRGQILAVGRPAQAVDWAGRR